jgi:pSer/pThr/pTyr-binding forkhead associated (FHA) protein
VPAKVILEVTSGPIQGKVFPFASHDTFLFGRHGTCHAQITKDPLVSRHHFILEANPPDVRLRDLGSLNGTLVNGVKHGGRSPDEQPQVAGTREYPEVDLQHGDRVTVGNTTIVVTIVLPLSCCQCGAEISEDDRKLAEWAPGSHMCRACRMGMVTAPRVPMKAPAPPSTVEHVPRCQCCGRDVAAEVGNRRGGDYVCGICRGELMSQVGGPGLKKLMQEATDKQRAPGALSIDGYELGEELGKGGMGVVYNATRKADGATLAIKVMLARVAVDEAARRMFLREIEIAQRLRHPHVVSLIESGSAGSAFYFVMELCNRGSLDRLIKRHRGKLSLSVAMPLMQQTLAGLEYAHQQGFVHRDLKPQNVLLHEQGGNRTAKITDFGLGKSFETAGLSGMTATGGFAGTVHFMPREQITDFKYVRPVSDVWSIAATFYNMLTGRFPLEFPPARDPVEVILHDEPIAIRRRDPSIPGRVAEVLDQALASDPARRYQTAGEMRIAVEQANGGAS